MGCEQLLSLVLNNISFDHRFRWVICQLEVLRHRIPGTISRALKELPPTLDETYARVLSSIDKDSQEYARCLFQCLCVSIRPLRLAEFANVLSILFDSGRDSEDCINWHSEDSQQALLSACSSLVTVVNINGSPVVQFAHFSVREYLMSDRLNDVGERLSRHCVVPHLAHTTLARASLNTLLSLDEHIDKMAVAKNHPLAIYGARYWVDHAKFGTVLLDIQELVERLFDRNRPCFAAWVWIYDFDQPWAEQISTAQPKQPEASPLYYASLCGFPRIVEHLAVTHPGDFNAKGGKHVTPLSAAFANREFDVARTLLQHGADINTPGMTGFSPLHAASFGGDRDAVQFLLEYQADANITVGDDNTKWPTPLGFAAFRGELEVCRLLVKHGAHINALNENTISALHTACQGGHPDVVKFLLDCGAFLDPLDDGGLTPLGIASQYGHADLVHILIKSGAAVNSCDDSRSTPLNEASKHGHLNVVQDLLLNGADPNIQDRRLRTSLHLASAAGYLDIVRLLIQHGSVLDKTDRYQETPLHTALRNGKLEVVQLLN
jgi:ankyrin repeat protein